MPTSLMDIFTGKKMILTKKDYEKIWFQYLKKKVFIMVQKN